MKKLSYFSFIQALLCTLVSTKRVGYYVQFFYFNHDSTKTLSSDGWRVFLGLSLWYCFILPFTVQHVCNRRC